VDHNTGHSFLGVMNKVTRRRNPWAIKTAIHLKILINNNPKK
jgi:hypothetical protein